MTGGWWWGFLWGLMVATLALTLIEALSRRTPDDTRRGR